MAIAENLKADMFIQHVVSNIVHLETVCPAPSTRYGDIGST